jgi:hypothetical protein
MKKLFAFSKYLPPFMRRKSTYVILIIIGFFYAMQHMDFVNKDALNPQAQTSLTPLDTTGVKAAEMPSDEEPGVLSWSANAVRVILSFDAENATLHFQRVLEDYFTEQGRGVFARALAKSGTVKYVTTSCRSEGVRLDGGQDVSAFGRRGDKNIWTVRVPVTLTDEPMGGRCNTSGGTADELPVTIVLLVEQNPGDTSNMKIDGWEMRPQ